MPRPPAGRPTRPRSAAGTSRSPSPGSGRRSGPSRRGRGRGCPAGCRTWCGARPPPVEDVWVGSRRPRLTPNSGSPSVAGRRSISLMPGQTPPESCQPPPDPPSHSPRMARAATRRRSCSGEGAGQRGGLPGGPHAGGDQAAEEVGRDGQARALGDVVDAADDLQPQPGADHARQQVGQALAGALDPGGTMPAAMTAALSRPEVVAGEVEDLGQAGDVGRGAQVDADQAQHRLVDHAEVGLDRRLGRGVAAAHAEVDRDVEHPRRPRGSPCRGRRCRSSAVGEVHPHGGALAQDREDPSGAGAQQLGRMRSGWSAGWPMRNIHWLPRTERTLRRTWSASVWKPRPW